MCLEKLQASRRLRRMVPRTRCPHWLVFSHVCFVLLPGCAFSRGIWELGGRVPPAPRILRCPGVTVVTVEQGACGALSDLQPLGSPCPEFPLVFCRVHAPSAGERLSRLSSEAGLHPPVPAVPAARTCCTCRTCQVQCGRGQFSVDPEFGLADVS